MLRPALSRAAPAAARRPWPLARPPPPAAVANRHRHASAAAGRRRPRVPVRATPLAARRLPSPSAARNHRPSLPAAPLWCRSAPVDTTGSSVGRFRKAIRRLRAPARGALSPAGSPPLVVPSRRWFRRRRRRAAALPPPPLYK
ncbi:uncharacterized protein A4U43_C02F11140 [Asparagus officinalis]|uniref:Uncharacterized protein n=1 Tax=Asparagus officinalis TaxID=4686 RepID=A0A5P1FK94_ASPOF|nr:uncharacterized protein A4U43_C02F11140 [Asparagus officinalis]